MLAKYLSEKGHDVVLWSSTFNHAEKVFRSNSHEVIQLEENFRLRLIHAGGYDRNISVQRVLHHRRSARAFSVLCSEEEPPDAIIASFPTAELCLAARKYSENRSLPLIIDVRDLWPDVYLEIVPQWLRRPARVVLMRSYSNTRRALSGADAVIGVTDEYVSWGVKMARRARTPLDKAFPHAYPPLGTGSEGCPAGRVDRFQLCFFGALGRHSEIETVIDAARILERDGADVRFVICGAGDRSDAFLEQAKDLSNMEFLGWVDGSRIARIMEDSGAGLAPFRGKHYSTNIPNKIVEYLAGGLPIVTSLDGPTGNLLRQRKCGLVYEGGSATSLAAAIRCLAEDKTVLETMAANAKETFNELFSAEVVLSGIERHLLEIVGTKEAP